MIPAAGTVNTATRASGLQSCKIATLLPANLEDTLTGTTAPFSAISGVFNFTLPSVNLSVPKISFIAAGTPLCTKLPLVPLSNLLATDQAFGFVDLKSIALKVDGANAKAAAPAIPKPKNFLLSIFLPLF
eukprot:Anaeramoba_ignava/a89975_2863.p8 GENE.a89975_2863~~a89975_2863.p8  ORF type:complete len:130 (+),score=3.35 a89975_2863:4469-4858(+)